MTKPTHCLKLLVLLVTVFVCVNSNANWKTCSGAGAGEVTFCKNLRATAQGSNNLELVTTTIEKSTDGIITSTFQKDGATTTLEFTLKLYKNSIFHLLIDEKNSERYKEANVVLDQELVSNVELIKTDTIATVTSGSVKAVITGKPFKIEFYNNNILISIVNGQNRLVFNTKTDTSTDESIAVDISFPGAQRAYGLPEHADRLALRNTDTREPYRHFNVDYGNYDIDSTEALYGAIGVLYAHAVTHSSGVFWFNPSQTWVDVKASSSPNQIIDTYFMSETGALNLFILAGPTLSNAVKQYATLTGVAPLPQYFTLGYHQSRYSYLTQAEVMEVSDEFDKINLPLDVLWLDIDYTDQMKYFTWSPDNFKTPLELQSNLMAKNRTLITIIDPHIKVIDGYFLHNEAKTKYYVKNTDNTDYVGKCWPGESSWLDFFNPTAFNYYSSLYKDITTFSGENVHVWNDMNEPSIFENLDHENTMPPTSKHNDGTKDIEHRSVHNIYGFHQVRATHAGMLKSTVKGRPFILTRSHFAGIQRYAIIWTGDNYASREYLQISFPMCLTEALAGVSFCGADVGGFNGIPSEQLYQRWYQAGAWLPFYRGHSANDVPRRDPYFYSQSVQERVKNAINQRYAHIPAWYTAFREHELTGEPVIRPIIYQYPQDSNALSIDDQVLLGTDILAAPVLTDEAVVSRKVYLPGGDEQIWYNIDEEYKIYYGTGYHTLPVTLDSVPVFYRGGSIISRKDTPRQTTAETINDPYTIYICLNQYMTAKGYLYEDDHKSLEYKNKDKHTYISMEFFNNTIFSTKLRDSEYGNGRITRVVILNPPVNITGGEVENGTQALTTEYTNNNTMLSITKVDLSITKEFKVLLTTKTATTTTGFGTILRLNSALLIFAIIIKAIVM